MEETEYWRQLEHRVCREIDGLKAQEFRGYWCDGFIPDSFDMEHARISGLVWMGIGGKNQESWHFSFHFENVCRREEIDWASLLPGENVTGWLSMNIHRKTMKITPQAALPDKSEFPLR